MTKRFRYSWLVATGIILAGEYSYAQSPHTGTDYTGNIPINFIRTWDATAPESDPNALMSRPLKDAKQTTQYFDGLGRPLQTVIKQGSLATGSTATDLVSPVEYDAFGREQFKWMPYASATDNTGAFKTTPFAQQLAFYNDPTGVLKNQGENYYYSQTVFEASPLNRVQESFAPGVSWAGTAGQALENNRHSGKVKYWLNTVTDDVKMWTVTDVLNSFGTYTLSTVNNGAGVGIYPAGELYKNVSVDEHGKQVQEFKDKEGKVILKKVQLTAGSDDGTGKNYAGWLSTYYIYDDLGNLRCVIQPEGIKSLTGNNWQLSTTLLNEQCFRYEYDSRNRMVMKKVPGAAAVYMVYDQRDRLVMTQDGNLNAQGKWMVTLYDDLNRPVQTGLWTDANTRTYHANLAAGSGTSFTPYPFTPATTPGSGWEKLTTTHYDDYAGLPSPLTSSFNNTWAGYFQAAGSSYPYYQPLTPTSILKGLTTWTETKVLGTTSTFITTVMLYDDKARPIQVKSINYTGGEDVTTTQYSWAGQPLITVQKTEKAGTNAQTTVVITQMSYDDLGRVTKVEKRQSHTQVPVNGVMNAMSDYKTLVSNEYDKLGRVKTKKLAPAYNGNTGLESIAYDYNIRGWMLGANREYAKDVPTNNYFGFDLGYDKASNGIIGNSNYATPQYNGNIEGMVWKSRGDGEKRKYDFAYDAANRLLKADFTQYTGGSFNLNAGVNYKVIMGDGTTLLPDNTLDPNTAYDDNGNIKQMQQWGLKLNTSDRIDNLKYTYIDRTNKLKSVTDFLNDATTKLGDFKTNTTHPQSSTKASLNTGSSPAQFSTITDYTYDVNGNMNLDNNKGITSITYNYLNLPETITLLPPPNSNNGSRYIVYTYDAAGNKLKKETYESMGPGANKKMTTTYLNGQVYESKLTNQGGSPEADDHTDVLQFIAQEEGRIRFKPAAGSIQASLQYDYMLKDHLGNVRAVLTEELQVDQYPAATMESALAIEESKYYSNLSNTRTAKPGWFNDPLYTTNGEVAKLKNNTGSQKIGPSILLKVMAGDSYDIRVASGWSGTNPTTGSNTNLLADLLNSLTNGVASVSGGKATAIELQNPSIGINSALSSFLGTQVPTGGIPKAYINWVLLDEQFKIVLSNSNSEQVGGSGSTTIHVKSNLTVSKSGYLYIYTSNESDNMDVYFDNLQVTHYRSPILEETHYYPFGLTMAGISSKAAGSLQNKEQTFQGQRFDDELGLNWIQFKWRNHDPQIGRFTEIDPLSNKYVYNSTYAFSENNVIAHVELEGLEKFPVNGGGSGDPQKLPQPLRQKNAEAVELQRKGDRAVSESKKPESPKAVVKVLVVNGKANGVGDVGHTALQVGNDVYNYYPTDKKNDGAWGSGDLLNSKGKMTVESRDEFDEQYTKDGVTEFSLNVTEQQADKISGTLNRKIVFPGTYSLAGNQCTSVAIESLNNAGILIKTNPVVNERQILMPRFASPTLLGLSLSLPQNSNLVTNIITYGGK